MENCCCWKNLSDASAKTIDGTGKHLTAGIIDNTVILQVQDKSMNVPNQ
jgi:hypothetical protein